MSKAPTIKTPRLILENHTLKFLSKEYVSWLNNPEVVKYSEQRHRKHSLASCKAYIESYKDSPNYLWAISQKKPRRHIGNICAIIDKNNGTGELRILIGDPSVYGQGFGLEAWSSVAEFLLKKLNLRKVYAGTLSINRGMLGVMKKTGMKKEGVLRKQYVVDGKPVDVVFMGKFR